VNVRRNSGFILALLALTGCATLGPSAQSTQFAVRFVELNAKSCLDVGSRELQFACHRMKEGSSVVIARRDFFPSRQLDGARFEKLSIVLPAAMVINGTEISIPNNDIAVFISYGSSAFAGKTGCYGFANDGSIRIIDLDAQHLRIEVNAKFNLKSPLEWKDQCGPKVVSESINALWTSLDQLSAWEGRPVQSDTPFEEAHPRLELEK
jgi:hypothetical protein